MPSTRQTMKGQPREAEGVFFYTFSDEFSESSRGLMPNRWTACGDRR